MCSRIDISAVGFFFRGARRSFTVRGPMTRLAGGRSARRSVAPLGELVRRGSLDGLRGGGAVAAGALHLGRLVVSVLAGFLDALLEFLDPLAEVAAEERQPAGAEDHQDGDDHPDPFDTADHRGYLPRSPCGGHVRPPSTDVRLPACPQCSPSHPGTCADSTPKPTGMPRAGGLPVDPRGPGSVNPPTPLRRRPAREWSVPGGGRRAPRRPRPPWRFSPRVAR